MATPQLAAVGDAWERLRAFADTVEAEAAPPTPSRPASPATFGELALDGVTFSWPSTPSRRGFLVGPIDFTLAPGEVVFITGQNGSGKSTFVKLLCGLYARDGGVMRVDGVEQPQDPGPAWRERFAAVFAEFVLFERLHGFDDVDPARVSALLAEMELDGKVRFADGRFDTLALSTGQRKRLALVVALLHDRPVYVFDEWAADQDPHFRERFYRQIVPALRARGKAVVAVTHDDDAFDACDRRIHFIDGEVGAP
ncbi:MAG: ATP-binding cassette domain-containing protein [Myxococcales bacterium]|nr:ATP-binding cassette domain-containing protein [Myxococcales bacterium]MCB9543858.1 ATP-binding cassette domain-containing protein [Myxococcales bacterium]MCB9553275.1 ATP-binding cassette domain-containing protein [Myxococcales bacterium]